MKIVLDFLGYFLYNNTMKNYIKQPWSHEERRLLASNWYCVDRNGIEKLFPNRTYNACAKQAKYLKDRGWPFKRA